MGIEMTSVYFLNQKTGWATGNSETLMGHRGTVYYTTDGGATWKPQISIELPLNDVYFADENNGWAVGGQTRGPEASPQAAMLLTQDGGKTWKPQEVDLQNPLFSVYFADSSKGWTVGLGAVWESKDGGKTWESMLPPPPEPPEGGGPGGGAPGGGAPGGGSGATIGASSRCPRSRPAPAPSISSS